MAIQYNQQVYYNMSILHQSKFLKTSLKRDRHAFQSTAFETMQQTRTIPRTYRNIQETHTIIHPTFKPPAKGIQKNQEDQECRIQVKSILEAIANNIYDEQSKCRREVNSKFMRHFYYRGISRVARHPLLNVPKVVIDLYQKEQIKRLSPSSPPVAFTQGFLPNAQCAYYAIESTIIFIRIQDLMDCNDPSLTSVPYTIHEVRNQVLSIIQIVGENLLFPSHELIIAITHPWEMQFYAWQFGNVGRVENLNQTHSRITQVKQIGLKSLNFIYKLPIESVKALDYSKDGRLFFFDQDGALHQMTPYQQTKLFVYKTGRYTIRNYVNNSHNTFQLLSNHHGKFSPLLNIASCVTQASKYLFPAKIQTKMVIIDKKRELLFALLKKKIQLLFGHQDQIFIVSYDIKQKSKLLHKFSEKLFKQKFGSHVHGEKRVDFTINFIRPAPSYYQNANLSAITQSGIEIIMQISQNDVKFVEIIRPPDHRMFEPDIGTLASHVQFPPVQRSQYRLISFLEDQQKTISTITKDKGLVVTYLTSNTVYTGTIDISQQANSFDLEIFREGEKKVKIHKVDQNRLLNFLNKNLFQQKQQYISELTKQILCPPAVYFFQGQSKVQLISYIRPIDVLFTILSVIVIQSQNSHRNIESYLAKDKFILKIFLSQTLNFSLVGNSFITVEQLCCMLMQILSDKGGMYYYSSETARDVIKIWRKIKIDKSGQIMTETAKVHNFENNHEYDRENFNKFNSNVVRNVPKQYQIRVGFNQIFTYDKISRKLLLECKQLLESLCIQGPSLMTKQLSSLPANQSIFYDFPNQPFDLSKVSKAKIIEFKINVVIRYLSRLLQQIWNTNINEITKQSRLIILTKLQFIYKFVQDTQAENKLCENMDNPDYQRINNQPQQLLATISRAIQLILLIEHVPFLPKDKTFGQCLRYQKGEFEEYMFNSIQKQYKSFIISKWHSLFPFFITPDFVKLIRIYGQIQDIPRRDIILKELKQQAKILKIPSYFINYLRKILRFTEQQIKQIVSLSQSREIRISPQGNDFEFIIPQKIREMANRYSKNTDKISEPDLLQLINIFKNRDQENPLTISNKKSLGLFIKTHFPHNEHIAFLLKCISVQYQLYGYYLKELKQNDKMAQNNSINILKIFNKDKKEKDLNYNSQTMALLRLTTIVDEEKLKKLVWLTADFWLMSDFCITFHDMDGLRVTLRQICQDYTNPKNKGYSSFASYLERYLLNFAIKSDYSKEILAIICSVIDQHLLSLPSTQGILISWMEFNSLSSITDKHIWLPQLLIKLGYSPISLFTTYIQSLEQIFDKALPFMNQLIYGFKFLNSYLIVDRYEPLQRKQFAKIITLELDALQRNNNIDEKSALGIRKMLDELVSKPLN